MKYDYTFNANSYKTPPVLYKKALDFLKSSNFRLTPAAVIFISRRSCTILTGKLTV